MDRLINLVKSIRLGKIVVALFAGVFLFISTACSNTPNVLAKTADQVREEVPSGAVTSKYQGGMNDYSDVDPRQDTKAAKAKAKGLVDSTSRQVIDMTDDVGKNTKRILDKKGENLDQFGDNVKKDASKVGQKTKDSASDFAKGTNRGTENLKDNTKDATKDAGDAVRNKVKSDIDTTQKNLDKADKATD